MNLSRVRFSELANLLFLCMLDSFFVIFVLVLYILEIVFSHKIVGVAALLFRFAAIYNFATRMSICRLPAILRLYV